MENHHFWWENPLYMAFFNSYVSLPEGIYSKPYAFVRIDGGVPQSMAMFGKWWSTNGSWGIPRWCGLIFASTFLGSAVKHVKRIGRCLELKQGTLGNWYIRKCQYYLPSPKKISNSGGRGYMFLLFNNSGVDLHSTIRIHKGIISSACRSLGTPSSWQLCYAKYHCPAARQGLVKWSWNTH